MHKYIKGTKNEPLAGVAFKVTDGNGGNVGNNDGVWYTDAQGNITIPNLEQGTVLTVREVETLDGFVLDGTPKQVEIKSSDVHELTFWNARAGSLVIRKLDSETKAPISGAKFSVRYADGRYVDSENGKTSSVGEYFTNRDGEIHITGLTGTVVVTEEAPAEGYTLDPSDKSKTIVINPAETQTAVFFNDPTQTLTIQKFIAGTTTPIEGVTFKVTSSDGTVVGENNGEFKTDRSGQIVITGLKPGVTITAQEIKTVSGFVLNDAPQSILIKQGAAQNLVFENERTA